MEAGNTIDWLLFSFMISFAVNLAFLTYNSVEYSVPTDCILAGVLLSVTCQADGNPATQAKVGVYPFNPSVLTFTDNRSLCFGLIGINSSSLVSPISQTVFIPNKFRLGRGRQLYLAGTSNLALGGSAYATYFFEELSAT